MAAFISRRRPRHRIKLTSPNQRHPGPTVRGRVLAFRSRGTVVADLWFYGRGAELFGPFSGWQVAELADAGVVLKTDTVWEDGNEDGVAADQIPHLFPATVATPAPPPAASTYTPYPARPTAGQRRAVAGPGAIISGQDGKTVRYTKKCTKCGKLDRSVSTATIMPGTMRSGFFCPKCRRRIPVEIQGR